MTPGAEVQAFKLLQEAGKAVPLRTVFSWCATVITLIVRHRAVVP